jgi:hypothetical protein
MAPRAESLVAPAIVGVRLDDRGGAAARTGGIGIELGPTVPGTCSSR